MAVEPEEVPMVQPLPQPLPEPLVQLLPGFIPTLEEDGLQLRVVGKRKTCRRANPALLIGKKKCTKRGKPVAKPGFKVQLFTIQAAFFL